MEPSLDCRTPPTSPELSRLKTKRRCPFGESPQPSKVPASESVMARDDSSTRTTDQSSTSITACAFEVLMNSQRSQRDAVHTSPLQPAVTSSSCQCWICHHYGDSMPCAFCEHSVCEMCVRQCDRCFGVFCAFCSTINYDNHEERPLCLTCHHEELRWQQNRAAQVVQQSGTWERPGMEVYRPLMA